jgi:hypothetical protein
LQNHWAFLDIKEGHKTIEMTNNILKLGHFP